MNNLIAVFKSKTEVFEFIEKMRYYGANCQAVPTPKEARQGCGISAEFQNRFSDLALRIIRYGKFRSFFGVFEINKQGGRISVSRIY